MSGKVSCLQITHDDKRLIAGSDNDLKVWNLEDYSLIKTIVAHSSSIAGISITSDDLVMVSAS